ncbi:MAG: response regulator, partial [Alphaproteobacteria bacterium]|nr:response regulator [Alphaproteobacteria bacterium]
TALQAHEPFRDFVYQRVGEGNRIGWISTSGLPVFDDDGNFNGYRGCGRDVTQLREAELRLQQAERLRAVGQLTGGVAHDFNNLLTAIIGNMELLEDTVAGDPAAERFLGVAKEAGQRGALLTQQLLAFGRKQDLRPTRTDISALVDQVVALISRTIGEDISIESRISSDLQAITVDAAQLQNTLINLAINGRDAMPNGGSLTIDVGLIQLSPGSLDGDRNIMQGQYLEISVTDTGIGMTADVLQRAMEPFFTTKGIGQGSGLGLAMAHGFVAQSGGHISIHSEPGSGTTVKLYLPAISAADDATADDTMEDEVPVSHVPVSHVPVSHVPVRGRETILLLDDDGAVRQFLDTTLSRLGYTVLSAQDAKAATDIARGGGEIDLLLADVTLKGGMNGTDFARQFATSHPATPIILMSGHAREALPASLAQDIEYDFVSKPVSRMQLAQKIRGILDHAAGQAKDTS